MEKWDHEFFMQSLVDILWCQVSCCAAQSPESMGVSGTLYRERVVHAVRENPFYFDKSWPTFRVISKAQILWFFWFKYIVGATGQHETRCQMDASFFLNSFSRSKPKTAKDISVKGPLKRLLLSLKRDKQYQINNNPRQSMRYATKFINLSICLPFSWCRSQQLSWCLHLNPWNS